MKKLTLALFLIAAFCLVAVSPVVADATTNPNNAGINSTSPFWFKDYTPSSGKTLAAVFTIPTITPDSGKTLAGVFTVSVMLLPHPGRLWLRHLQDQHTPRHPGRPLPLYLRHQRTSHQLQRLWQLHYPRRYSQVIRLPLVELPTFRHCKSIPFNLLRVEKNLF